MIQYTYLFVILSFFTCAIIFSVLINGLLLRFSRTLGVREFQRGPTQRWSSQIKPSLGGISFYIIFLLSISVYTIFPQEDAPMLDKTLGGLILAITTGFFIGLADDAYNTNPFLKFFGQFICGNILIASNYMIEVSSSYSLNYVFTVFWVIGMMNSINMIDNMDGIAGSISLSIIVGALVLLWGEGSHHSVYGFILLGVIAALIGFLMYNWHPAKMYMGDTGSQFLGVLLAIIGIRFFWNQRANPDEFTQLSQFLIPIVAFLVPITDTATVSLHRILRGQSPFLGGKDHTTHHLAYLGVNDGKVGLIFGITSFIFCLGAVSLTFFIQKWFWGYSISILLFLMVFFIGVQWYYLKAAKIKQSK